MRWRGIILLIGAMAIAAAAFGLLGRSPRRMAVAPIIAINVLGYTNQAGLLQALVLLTNSGPGVACYDSVGLTPCGRVKALTPAGWTNRPFTSPRGRTFALPPGAAVSFAVTLPTGALRWKYGLQVHTGGSRGRNQWQANLV